MPMTINGSGSISGLSAGGLPDGSIITADLADANVTPAKLSQALTLGTAQNSTSGTAIDFTGIPSWAKVVKIIFRNFSTNGASSPLIQVGTSSGFLATGYLGASSIILGTVGSANYTTGFGLGGSAGNWSAARVLNGEYTLYKQSDTEIVCAGVGGISDAAGTFVTSGGVTLPSVLNSVRITTVNGTDTFDAGSINILYEG